MGKRQLKTLDLETKVRIIEAIEKGEKKKGKIAEDFQIPQSTLSSIWRDREKLRHRFYSARSSGKSKRNKPCMYEGVDKAVLEWFESMRENNVPLRGVMLKQKAIEVAKALDLPKFKASNGWLNRFKLRHCINRGMLMVENVRDVEVKCEELDIGADAERDDYVKNSSQTPDRCLIEKAIETLQTAIEMSGDVPDDIFYCLYKIESFFKGDCSGHETKIKTEDSCE